MEIWKPVPYFELLYQVSNSGKVKSLRNNIILKSSSVRGYRKVILSDKKMNSRYVHRLVAEVFISNPNNLPEVNHIDGNKENNDYLNLEWVTPSQNVKHSYLLGRVPKRGQSHERAKITDSQVIEIRSKYIPYKYSYARIGKEYGLDQSTISDIVNRKNWKHV